MSRYLVVVRDSSLTLVVSGSVVIFGLLSAGDAVLARNNAGSRLTACACLYIDWCTHCNVMKQFSGTTNAETLLQLIVPRGIL